MTPEQIGYVATLPAQVGVLGLGMRAYVREGTRAWRTQHPEDAAAHDARKGRSAHFQDGTGDHERS